MKNYDLELKKIINNLDYKPNLLLHTCCGPCSTYVIEYLNEYFNITIYFYNPNIEPYNEYLKRKEELLKFLNNYKNIKIIDDDYDNNLFKLKTKHSSDLPEGGSRCSVCYALRLENTAIKAKTLDFEYFSTTLTVSPYKNSGIINNIGISLERKHNIKYLVSDFKKSDGYKKSIELSKKYDLYRQDYCGCLNSKKVKE